MTVSTAPPVKRKCGGTNDPIKRKCNGTAENVKIKCDVTAVALKEKCGPKPALRPILSITTPEHSLLAYKVRY